MMLQTSTASKRLVVLLELTWTRDKDPRLPLGHASLLAALCDSGKVEIESVVYPVNKATSSPQELVDKIMAKVGSRPATMVDLAIGTYVWGEELLQSLLPTLRKVGFGGRVILGGPQISYAEAGTLETTYPDADIFIRGYGEQALCLLTEGSHWSQSKPLQGVHFAGTEDRCEQASIALDLLPSPWLSGLIPLEGQKFIRWETQRGCPYKCAFCQHKEPGARLKRKTLHKDRLFQEIELFCAKDVKAIAVLDPIFNIGRRATDLLLAFVEHSYSGHLSLQCRAESTTDEFIEVASMLNVTLEFGLQTIHEIEGRAIDRRNNIAKVEKTLAKVRAHKIHHEVSLIFGLPEQTLSSFQESVSWCLKQKIPVIKAFPLMLLRGTELSQQRERWSLEEEGEYMPTVVASASFSRSEWHHMNTLSEALKQTEGSHPTDLQSLLKQAEPHPTNWERWRPANTSSHKGKVSKG